MKSILQRNRHYYVCVINDEIVGFTIVIEESRTRARGKVVELYLAILVVGEKHRRKGIGRKLSRFVESIARSKGITRIHCRVEESNPSLRLFQSEGFQRMHIILLEKHLPPRNQIG